MHEVGHHRKRINSKEQDALLRIRESQCGLTFHDLRRQAGSRFDEAGLTKTEHDLMLGHENPDISSTYIAPYLTKIENKINTYWADIPHMFDKTMRNAISSPDAYNMIWHMVLETLGEDVSILQKWLEKQEKEKQPIPEAISNVIPFLRKRTA